MKLGLGTGSTTKYFLEGLGEMVKSGKISDITGVPTSVRTEELARSYGIKTVNIYASVVLALGIIIDVALGFPAL